MGRGICSGGVCPVNTVVLPTSWRTGNGKQPGMDESMHCLDY